MTNLEIAEVVTDLQTALSKALNGEVIREYEHLQVRAEEVVKNCSIPDVVGQSEQLKAFQKIVNETKGYTAISNELIDKYLEGL